MKRLILLVTVASVAASLRIPAAAESDRFAYPQAPQNKQVDTYFGTKVSDPYRDLENADSGPTKKWIEAENKLTFDYLAGIPERKRINDKLTALWNYEKYTVPFRDGGRYFFPRTPACRIRACSTLRRVCRAMRRRCSIRIHSRKMAPSPSAEST